MKYLLSLVVIGLLAPHAAQAQQMTFATFVDGTLVPIMDGYVIRLLYALAFLFFVFGIARMFFYGESEEKRAEGKEFAIWGILALVILFGVWSIVRMFVGFLGGSV